MHEKNKLEVGSKVVLRTFLHSEVAPLDVRSHEDYWRLIGSTGSVVSINVPENFNRHPMGARVLVQFDIDVSSVGLECHNEIANSLWIFVIDLDQIE